MVKLVFHSDLDRAEDWLPELKRHIPDLDAEVSSDVVDPASIDVALIWKPPPRFAEYTNLKAILSLGAGVDQLDLHTLPVGVPIARLRDPSLIAGMVEYCRLAVLRYHRDFHFYERSSRERGPWRFSLPRPPQDRRIGVLGLGELGAAVAVDLSAAGFRVQGWARTPKSFPAVRCCVGLLGLHQLAAFSDVLINLLPLTSETVGILNTDVFARMPRGAFLINVGRGRHLVEEHLLLALRSGQLGGATLDVFQREPLPQDHPFWGEPSILITPHVATAPNPKTAALQVASNIKRAVRGEPLLNAVDRAHGY
jgi:glyoxylate/hydroxypyruvate reductase A